MRGDEAKTLVSKLEKHTGVVAALDCNPFQSNLLASGAGAAEIYIWDLNSPSVPMTPGTKAPVCLFYIYKFNKTFKKLNKILIVAVR